VLVIGAGGKARAITGYTQAKEIDQAVSDIGGKGFEARRPSSSRLRQGRRRRLQGLRLRARPEGRPAHDRAGAVQGLGTSAGGAERTARIAKVAATTPAERKLKSALIAWTANDSKWIADARRKLKAGAEPANVYLALSQLESDGNNATVAAAKKLHIRSCYAND
jgi:hypothetical protein